MLAPPILLTLNLILICCCRRWRKELRKRKLLLSAQLVSGTGEHRDKPSNFHIAYVVSRSLQTTACTKAVHSHGVAPTFYAPTLGCCTTDCNICSVFIIPYAIVYCSTISNCTCNEMCWIPSEHLQIVCFNNAAKLGVRAHCKCSKSGWWDNSAWWTGLAWASRSFVRKVSLINVHNMHCRCGLLCCIWHQYDQALLYWVLIIGKQFFFVLTIG